jgi:colanic acid/amylovoran biosynthesis glycosyltransferase
MKKNLYFFTSSFPFTQNELDFLENEILFLAKAFEKITIVPLYCYKITGFLCETPENCTVIRPIITSKWQHYLLGLFCLKSIPLYWRDFFGNRVYRKMKWLKMFLIDFCTTNNLLQSRELKKALQQIQKDDVMYFYWGKGASNLLPFITKLKTKKVVRYHGGDLYNSNYGGYLPIQEAILRETDISVLISKNGQQYLKNTYPHLRLNSVVSYLGTKDNGMSRGSNDNIFRLLSCSSVIPLKRLSLIYDALQMVTDQDIEWTHIGDGIDFEKLKEIAQLSRNNVRIKLLGRLPHQDVLIYYRSNMIDAFINVSTKEGLPVSIMEAISSNVPVLATDVGGTSEIVTSETGILLSSNPTVYEIVDALKKIRHLTLQPRIFWERNFNSEVNYSNFINEILISE